MKNYEKLERQIEKISHINNAIKILHWDNATYIPQKSTKTRHKEIATLATLSHGMFISEDMKKLINKAEEYENLDEWQISNLREIKRHYLHDSCINEELLYKYTKSCNECEFIWRDARKNNDYNILKPYLQKVLDYTIEIASIKSEKFGISKYETLLDIYNTGITEKEIQNIFDVLRKELPLLIKLIIEKQSKETLLPIIGNFDISKQKNLGKMIMKKMGFDFSYGRLDESTHPFCGGTPYDIRLTNRYNIDEYISGIMGIIHETGHGLYEMNLPENYKNQFVGKARNFAVHESQSLIMEKQAAITKEFIEFLAKNIRDVFGLKGKEHEAKNIYNTVTKVKPSFIRVDADEVTYPLHVIIRFELERDLINKNITLDDLPTYWGEKMDKYLGINPNSNHKNGCLQDIHWPSGAFGYFPAYSIGAVLASMLMGKAKVTNSNISNELKLGEFTSLNKFLNKNLRNFGSLYQTKELIKLSTGESELSAQVFISYLKQKYL